ncbi:MAG: gamma-glutamylcyclotransferase family protein [Rhodanobacteraceae bacterium]
MLYFAYGSNMDWAQIRQRCPSARFLHRATLPDRQLAFTRGSVSRGCGVADVVRAPDQRVWGVVYDIGEADVGTLDTCEGYAAGRERNAYWRRECLVLVDDDTANALACSSYFATPQPEPPLPSRAYVRHLLAGARHWKLPGDYLTRLEAIATAG